MKIKFIYSFSEEIKEAINLMTHKSNYQNLRSVLWPSFSNLTKYALNSKVTKLHVETFWNKYSDNVEIAFEESKLKKLDKVTCYLHSLSCEGWFDVENNSIHIRTVESGGDKELLNTIVHELLHLATYNKQMTYEERESLVENYLNKPQFKRILIL